MSLSSQSTPRYPPPPGLPGSRPSQSFEIIDSPGVDPELINPSGTEPTGTPGSVSGNTPKDETSAFVFPPPVDTKDEKKKTSRLPNLGGSVRGGFGKFKGLFKKGPKPAPELQSGKSIEDLEEDDLAGSREFLDDTAKTPPYPTDKPSGGKMDQLGTSLRNIFKKPQNADPAPYSAGDVVELKGPSKKTYLTFGNFLAAMLVALMVCGIIMCACIGVNGALYYIGPAALGLAFFALVGKCFFTLFWEEDPFPTGIKPNALRFEKLMGGVKDPYGLQSGTAYRDPRMLRLYPRTVTTTTTTETVQTGGQSLVQPPPLYDESMDTRPREEADMRAPYPYPASPGYTSEPDSPDLPRQSPGPKVPW